MFRTAYKPLLIIFFLFLLLAGGTSFAAEKINLEDAVALALGQNLEILSARQENVKAQGLVKIARGAFFPSLSVNGEYTRQEETVTRIGDSYGGDLSVSQKVYMGGKLWAYRKQADYNLVIAESSISATEERVVLEVYSRFYSVLLARENVTTAEDALAYAEDYALELKKKKEVGLATSLEVTRAEQLRVASRQDLLEARNDLKAAKVLLFELLRISSDQDREVEGVLEYLPENPDQEGSLEKAFENRPELVNLRTRILFQEENIEIARAGLRPDVSVTGKWSYDDPATGTTGSSAGDDTWSVKVNVNLPLYDNGITRGKVTQEEASLQQAINNLSSQEDSIRSEISTLVLELQSTASRVEETAKNLELAEESLRLAEVGYREGVGIQLDVLEARRSLTQVRLSYSSAVKDYNLGLARLRKAEGRLVSYSLKGKEIKE